MASPEITPTEIPDVCLVDPKVFSDERGFFLETFNERSFALAGLTTRFRQDNWSRSTRGVLRGLHFQLDQPQGKLVTVVQGDVFDVAVDIRVGSPTFLRWVGVELSGRVQRSLWIPPGFAHGFCVLSDSADVVYKCTELYDPADDRGLLWNDPRIAISWPLTEPLVSARDRSHAPLDSGRQDLPRYLAGD